eukprot:2302642-Amphidinium_carterae.1
MSCWMMTYTQYQGSQVNHHPKTQTVKVSKKVQELSHQPRKSSTSPREDQGSKPTGTKNVCRIWKTSGTCRFGDKCKYWGAMVKI